MQKLVHGIHLFRNGEFRSKRELFRSLAQGQKPAALFITCSDSRINPNLLTQTDPGDLFVLRNAGNIIPAAPTACGGEIATIEFAIVALGIRDVIVCGHSDCGAMKGLMDPDAMSPDMPSVTAWLEHARRTAEIIDSEYGHLTGQEKLMATIEENVLVQIENLKSHPFIEERLARGDLNLHGWVYKFATGEVFNYDAECGQFAPLGVADNRPVYPRQLKVVSLNPALTEEPA